MSVAQESDRDRRYFEDELKDFMYRVSEMYESEPGLADFARAKLPNGGTRGHGVRFTVSLFL